MGAQDKIDAVIIGAGVVGAAVAHELCGRGLQCWLLDQRERIGGETTERNSGVIHAGLYYPENSLKTKLCVTGNALLYAWASKHQVAHRRCGKIILARSPEEETLLASRLEHAQGVGVTKIRYLSRQEIQEETGIAVGRSALLSENTGIIDPVELTRSLIAHAKNLEVLVETKVQEIAALSDGYLVETSRGPVRCSIVINAAGLYADKIANLLSPGKYTLYPCRGNYFRWRTKRQIQRLIYPVKVKDAPGLGIHLSLGLDGSLKWGPDAEFLKEGLDYSPADHRHPAFLEAVRRLYPEVRPEELSYESCGIRPKLRSPDDENEKDFVIAHDHEGFIDLVGIESPGLTASLAIAKHVSTRLGL
jgi:L-2-hydroxyglutarate oxidase LhgO